jgi:MFS family permease
VRIQRPRNRPQTPERAAPIRARANWLVGKDLRIGKGCQAGSPSAVTPPTPGTTAERSGRYRGLAEWISQSIKLSIQLPKANFLSSKPGEYMSAALQCQPGARHFLTPCAQTPIGTMPARRCHHHASMNSPDSLRPIDRRWPRFALRPDDLLRDRTYRRLWASTLISSFGAQVTLLALPLTAAVLLDASPSQMGLLTAMEVVPFVLFSLPAGVWLDRVKKLPVYVLGEVLIAGAVTSVPLAWWLGGLSMPWLYLVAFAIGAVNTTAGSASQIVLTQLVPRERLVEGHARNALASSMAEVMGPGAAGLLIKLTGAPVALLADAALMVGSALILRGIHVPPEDRHPPTRFWPAMRGGLDFVMRRRLLITMALAVGIWQFCYQGSLAVQILFGTRLLGLSERAVGLSYVALGVGTILTSAVGNRVVRRIGPGPALVLGFAVCGVGWSSLALAPLGALGVAAFALMLFLFGVGAVLIFINFLALRQAVTPAPMLGRMTSTMRWLILLPAGPGALFGGWIGEQFGLRATLAFSGVASLLLAAVAWRQRAIRDLRTLPSPDPGLDDAEAVAD